MPTSVCCFACLINLARFVQIMIWFNIVSPEQIKLLFQIWLGSIKRAGTGHRWTRNCVGRSTEIFHNFSELKVILEFKRSSYFLVPAHVYSGAGIYSTQDICPMLKKYFFETCYLVLSIKDNIKSLFYIIISILWLLSVAEIFCSRFWLFENRWE